MFYPRNCTVPLFLFCRFLHCWILRHHIHSCQIQINQCEFLHCYSHALFPYLTTLYLLCTSAEVSTDSCKWKKVFWIKSFFHFKQCVLWCCIWCFFSPLFNVSSKNCFCSTVNLKQKKVLLYLVWYYKIWEMAK